MMPNLYLPDGSLEIIISPEDFQKLIREKLGKDAEDYFIETFKEKE
jgi:hypothetical protein